jgi:hypothetical protein
LGLFGVDADKFDRLFTYLKFYIMITKFCTINENETNSIEFSKTKDDFIHIEISDNNYPDVNSQQVIIDKQDLFSLIGQLLRLQSEIKKNEEFERLSNTF